MNATDLVALTPMQFAAVIALFLPGFVSLRVDRLIHPGKDQGSANDLLEILGYSLLNAGVLSWAVLLAAKELSAADPDYVILALLAALICVAGPLAWPLLFRTGQRGAARRGWVMSPHRTAWDDFFSRKQPCWVVLHLNDGSLVGGYFGDRSIASVGVDAGHIYRGALGARFSRRIHRSHHGYEGCIVPTKRLSLDGAKGR